MYETPQADIIDLTNDEVITPVKYPLLAIFTAPRRTVLYISREKPNYLFYPIIILYGLITSAGMLWDEALFEFGLTARVGGWLGYGTVGNLIYVFAYGLCLKWVGGWFGAKTSARDMRIALVWSFVVVFPVLFAVIAFAVIWGIDSPVPDDFALHLFNNPPLAVIGLLAYTAVFFVWSTVVCSHAIAEVSGFTSAWRGFAVWLIALLLLMVMLMIFGMVAALVIGFGAAFLMGSSL
nr:YIP1 family protein [Pleionea sp. CnH1-48]